MSRGCIFTHTLFISSITFFSSCFSFFTQLSPYAAPLLAFITKSVATLFMRHHMTNPIVLPISIWNRSLHSRAPTTLNGLDPLHLSLYNEGVSLYQPQMNVAGSIWAGLRVFGPVKAHSIHVFYFFFWKTKVPF